MSLERLFQLAEARVGVGEMRRVCFPVSTDIVEMVDEMAAEIGISRAQVLREATTIGVQQLHGLWTLAVENAKKEKAEAKKQHKLKLAGGE